MKLNVGIIISKQCCERECRLILFFFDLQDIQVAKKKKLERKARPKARQKKCPGKPKAFDLFSRLIKNIIWP